MTGSGDRHAIERLPVGADTSCGFAAPLAADIVGVKIRDVSMNGIGLISIQKVDVGSRLALGICNKRQNINKTVILKVTHVKPITGGYLIAGEFTAPLTYQEFTSLVM